MESETSKKKFVLGFALIVIAVIVLIVIKKKTVVQRGEIVVEDVEIEVLET